MKPTDALDLSIDPIAAADQARAGARLADTATLDTREVMSTLAGRRFVQRVLDYAGVNRTSFNTDPHLTAFNEGQRNVGLRLMADLAAHAPASNLKMISEGSNS